MKEPIHVIVDVLIAVRSEVDRMARTQDSVLFLLLAIAVLLGLVLWRVW